MLSTKTARNFVKGWLRVLVVLILTVLVIFTFTLIICSVLPIYSFRFLLVKFAKWFRPDLGKILTARSATFATDDLYRNPKASLLFVVVLEGRKTLEEIRERFLKDTIQVRNSVGEFIHPEFQQFISSWMGFPFWKWENEFKIENHIKMYDGQDKRPIPILTKDVLNEICTEYLKTPFTPGRSPWEIIVFPNCDLENENASMCAIFRLSHSLADGFSGVEIFSSPADLNFENNNNAPQNEKSKIVRSESFLQKLVFNVIFIFRAPYEFVSTMMEAFDVNECHIPEDKLSKNVLLAFSERIQVSKIKEIRKHHSVDFTAVLLAGFTGAMRSLFLENGMKMPEAVHAVVPCQIKVVAHSGKLRNVMSVSFVRLPVLLSNSEERLQEIQKNLKKIKKSSIPVTTFYLLPLMGGLPRFLSKLFFRQVCPTALISNFPGPLEQRAVFGLPVIDGMFSAGLLPGNIGIGFNAASYRGETLRIQAAFNESLARSGNITRNFLLDKVLDEFQSLIDSSSV